MQKSLRNSYTPPSPQESTTPLPWLLSRCSELCLCLHKQRGQKYRKEAETPLGEVTAIGPTQSALPTPPKPIDCANSQAPFPAPVPVAAGRTGHPRCRLSSQPCPPLPSGCASQHSRTPAGAAAASIKVWTVFYIIWSLVIHKDRWYLWILEIKSLRAGSRKKPWKQAVHMRFCRNVMYQKPVSTKTGEVCKGSLPYALFELWTK